MRAIHEMYIPGIPEHSMPRQHCTIVCINRNEDDFDMWMALVMLDNGQLETVLLDNLIRVPPPPKLMAI